MKELGSLADLAMALEDDMVRALEHSKKGLEKAAILLKNTCKQEIGVYQRGAGPFEAWDLLADATEADKARQGYPLDAPLERTNALRASFKHEIEGDGWSAIVGSTDPVLVYHEFGTSKMPPRPVLGMALYRNLERIQRLIGDSVTQGFVGGEVIHPSLGYDTGHD